MKQKQTKREKIRDLELEVMDTLKRAQEIAKL